jgi:hypothetical protein
MTKEGNTQSEAGKYSDCSLECHIIRTEVRQMIRKTTPPGGHQSSDPGGGQGRVDAGRNRRFHQRCEKRAAPWQRIGNWLTREQAQELLSLPDRESLKGKRDYAILALLLGCGLRRTELVSEVKVGAIAGKGNRVRSVAVPAWVKAAIDAWTTAAGVTKGKIFRAVRKGGKVWGQDLTLGAVLGYQQHPCKNLL